MNLVQLAQLLKKAGDLGSGVTEQFLDFVVNGYTEDDCNINALALCLPILEEAARLGIVHAPETLSEMKALVDAYDAKKPVEITYAHQNNPHGQRFQQMQADPPPVWAVDVKVVSPR